MSRSALSEPSIAHGNIREPSRKTPHRRLRFRWENVVKKYVEPLNEGRDWK